MNLDNYIGLDPKLYATAVANGTKIQAAKTTGVSSGKAVAALTNQTGGTIMGFTYE